MISVPIPRLRLKKTCPIALSNIENISEKELTADRSGIMKNFKPFNAFGNFITLIAIIIINTASIGRKILLIFSIPPEIPFITIIIHIIAKVICHKIGS